MTIDYVLTTGTTIPLGPYPYPVPNVCPGCGRCRDCGRQYPDPVYPSIYPWYPITPWPFVAPAPPEPYPWWTTDGTGVVGLTVESKTVTEWLESLPETERLRIEEATRKATGDVEALLARAMEAWPELGLCDETGDTGDCAPSDAHSASECNRPEHSEGTPSAPPDPTSLNPIPLDPNPEED